MCVWTEKRGSMNAVVLMATPCPKSLHGKGEKWIARIALAHNSSIFAWIFAAKDFCREGIRSD